MGAGFSVLFRTGGEAGKLCGSGIVALNNVESVSLVVLEYSYEGVLAEGGGGDETLVSSVSYRANEVVDRLVDLLGREVGGWGAGEGVELVKSEHTLLLVTPPSKQLAGAGNGGNVGRGKVR